MIRTRITKVKEVGARISAMPGMMNDELKKAMQSLVVSLVAQVKADKLSGQVLNVRTGRLRRSITGRVEVKDNTVRGEIGTNVFYGLIHEFGRSGAGKAAASAGNLPKRAFLRPTLYANKEKIQSSLTEAVKRAINARS